jgi:uncharacterized membrane-anchored protein
MRALTITTAGLALWALIGFGVPARADQDPAPVDEPSDEQAAPEGPVFDYQTGNIVLPNKVATLHLAGNYRYLDPAETEKLLVAWGNEPGSETQGAVVPNEIDPMSDDGWAVIVTYEDEGHIDDSDAAEIDYDDLLSDMKEGTEDNNAARKKAGYQAVHLIGWAEKPRYDAAAKKLYWAKELSFEGSPVHTLNYDVRVLGREGVLSMNAVASFSQLAQIRSDMRPLIEIAEFNQGHRYAEFNSRTDRMAEYGLGALIAGGVAAKLGLFGKLAALLLAFKKFIIVGLVAVGGFFARLFKKKDAAV